MASAQSATSDEIPAQHLTIVTIAGSVLIAPALYLVHRVSHSQLALAQAADSLSDSLGGLALVWAVRTSARAADEEHPLGHARAEPIAALVVAVLVGILSIEVLRAALFPSERPRLDWPVAAVFLGKIAFKSVVLAVSARLLRRRANPALDALRVDAQSDVLVCSLSLAGVVLAHLRWSRLDAVLAVAVAVYIAASGLRLGRENVGLLLGTSAPSDRRADLTRLVAAVPGVVRIDRLVAIYHGSSLHVHVDIQVDRELSLLAAHAIGHAVESALEQEPDVSRAVAHVGPS
jgi:cation diffusion facilitator family transporter